VTIDANVLLYTANEDDPLFGAATETLNTILTSGEPVVVFPPVLVAFLRVATHPNVFQHPLTLSAAFGVLRRVLQHPSVSFAAADETFVQVLEGIAGSVSARGNLIHDAEIVALMQEHNVARIVTSDRDFLRFPGINVTLVEP